MKLIVPIDYTMFSYYAIHAAKVILSKQETSELILFHAVEKIENAVFTLDKIEAECNELNIVMSYYEADGEFISSFSSFLETQSCDLVIMGSHGASGKREWFLGSNTQKVIRSIRQPVLTVKSPIESLSFDEVCFVSGLDFDDQEVFRRFLEKMKLFKVKEVHLLTIDTRSFFSQPTILMIEAMKDFKKIGEDYNVITHFYPDDSIESGIRHFIEDKGIDLAAISNHSRHLVKRIFQGSTVEMVVNHLHIPVLTIDY